MPELENALPVADHERSYEEIRTIGVNLRKKGDAYDWWMGDLANELTERADRAKERYLNAGKDESELAPEDVELKEGGKKAMNRFSKDLGMQTAQIAKRRHVSRAFPRNHRARTMKLSYSMVREIAFVPDAEKREKFIESVASGDLTVRDVMDMVAKDRDKDAANKGLLSCAKCHEKIINTDMMVRIGFDGTSHLFDNWRCAALYAQEQAGLTAEANMRAEMDPEMRLPTEYHLVQQEA